MSAALDDAVDSWRLPPARHAGALVFEALRDRILSGELAHGARLSEAWLAGKLGVSRTPVREALTRLTAAGLLRPTEPAGVEVIDPLADLEELVLMREALEGCAARLAAQRALPEEAARIAALAEASGQRRPFEFEARNVLNAAFHDAVLAAAHSPRLSAQAESYRMFFASPRLMRRMDAEETRAALADHRGLAGAVLGGGRGGGGAG